MNTIIAAANSHVVNELPVPAWVYGVVVFALLMFLLLATMSLRSVTLRREVPTTAVATRERQYNFGNDRR